MTFGTAWGFGADEALSHRMFDLYADRRGNFIDTANVCTDGASEKMVGAFLKGWWIEQRRQTKPDGQK